MCHIPLPTPSEVAEDPELAVLVSLAQSLEISRVALLAYHRDLGSGELDGRSTHSAQDAYAGAITHQLQALSLTVGEHIESIRRLRSLRADLGANNPERPF